MGTSELSEPPQNVHIGLTSAPASFSDNFITPAHGYLSPANASDYEFICHCCKKKLPDTLGAERHIDTVLHQKKRQHRYSLEEWVDYHSKAQYSDFYDKDSPLVLAAQQSVLLQT